MSDKLSDRMRLGRPKDPTWKEVAALEAENKGLHIEAREQVVLIHDEQAKVTALEARLSKMEEALLWSYFDGRTDWPDEGERAMALEEALAGERE